MLLGHLQVLFGVRPRIPNLQYSELITASFCFLLVLLAFLCGKTFTVAQVTLFYDIITFLGQLLGIKNFCLKSSLRQPKRPFSYLPCCKFSDLVILVPKNLHLVSRKYDECA